MIFDKHVKIAEGLSLYDSLYHGATHWRQVYMIAKQLGTSADMTVVALFAAYHDAWRVDDGADPKHGQRGADAVWQAIRETETPLTDKQRALLEFAIRYHCVGFTSDDETVGTCWDADRLDLPRVGVVPRPQYMSTAQGKEAAREYWL